MDKRSTNALRFMIASIVGDLVAILALAAAWQAGNQNSFIRGEQGDRQAATQTQLRDIEEAVGTYSQKLHLLPSSLNQLRALPDYDERNEYGHLSVDGWGRPFRYFHQGNDFQIVSYGRDGKPGGTGPDCDLSNVNPYPPQAIMPLWKFLLHPWAEGMILACFLAGALASVLSWSLIGSQDLSRGGHLGLAVKLVLTLIATLVVGLIMIALDTPTGH